MPAARAPPPDETATYKQLHAELMRRGVTDFRFVRVPGPYYEESLEFRAKRLQAASAAHLCKTMVMENKDAPKDVVDCSDARRSRYYMVRVAVLCSRLRCRQNLCRLWMGTAHCGLLACDLCYPACA